LRTYRGQITVLQGDHRGVGAARNKILAAARGEMIALLDADDIWLPGKISRQMQMLLDRPQAAFCHSGAEMFGSEQGDGPITEDRRRKIHGSCFEAQFLQTGVVTSTLLVRRRDMPAQGFPEDMPTGEDYCLLLMMLSTRDAHYWPACTTRMRRRPGQATGDRGTRLQVYNGLARLRALDYLRGRLDPDMDRRLRDWALQELATCAYSRYWKGDYQVAARAFGWLGRYGRKVPWRHRAKAIVGSRLGRAWRG
jgi:glycosyltransferase involved in cell wall biosynthesis